MSYSKYHPYNTKILNATDIGTQDNHVGKILFFFFKPTVFLGFINFDILLLLKLFFRHFTKKEAIKVTNIVRNSKQVQTNINTNYR